MRRRDVHDAVLPRCNARRGGLTLIELLLVAIPALLLLGLVLHLIVRSFAADRWNGARLGSVDAVLIATEHLRADLATTRAGDVQLGPDGLSIATGAAGSDSRAVYAPLANGFLRRNGRPLRGASLSAAAWSWSPEHPSLLHLELAGTDQGRVSLQTQVQVPERAARLDYPGWSDRD
jgi:hypothetical protein